MLGIINILYMFVLTSSLFFQNPKVVRSSMGTILRFPVISTTWSDVAELLPASVMYMMADGAGAAIWDLQNVTKPLALVVGSEATGISQEVLFYLIIESHASNRGTKLALLICSAWQCLWCGEMWNR